MLFFIFGYLLIILLKKTYQTKTNLFIERIMLIKKLSHRHNGLYSDAT